MSGHWSVFSTMTIVWDTDLGPQGQLLLPVEDDSYIYKVGGKSSHKVHLDIYSIYSSLITSICMLH